MITESNQIKQLQLQLQRRRQEKWSKALWRSLVLTGLTTSILGVWLFSRWTIHYPEQIVIEGNGIIADQQIYNLLQLDYPSSIWQLSTQQLTKKLQAVSPITQAIVTRQLFPPTLKITLIERVPVAQLLSSNSTNPTGFLDAEGVWLDQNFYQPTQPKAQLPELKVIGYQPQYQSYWQQIYQLVEVSNIQIFSIDWRDPANLMLETTLGTIHLGSYSDRLPEKFAALSSMENLPAGVEIDQISYITLINPDAPQVRFK